MKRSISTGLMVLSMSFFLASCGKKNKDSSTPVKKADTSKSTTPAVVNNGTVKTMEELNKNFDSLKDTDGLKAGQEIVFSSLDADPVKVNNTKFQGFLNFIGFSVGTVEYELIKVESVDSGVLKFREGESIYNLGATKEYSKENHPVLNDILSKHDGAATVVFMRAAKVHIDQKTVKNATYIQMSKAGKIYEYVLSSEMPRISNPIYSYDGSTQATKQLAGILGIEFLQQ